MEHSYSCPQCGQPGTANVFLTTRDGAIIRCRSCHCAVTKAAYLRLRPPAFRDTDPQRIPKLVDVCSWKFGPVGLLLHGPSATGKSRSVWKLLERLMCQEGIMAETFDCVSFGHELARHYRADDAEDWLDRLGHRADLVFFDDLGKLKLTERAEAELFGVIDRRCSHHLPIIATTNDTGDSLASRMTEGRAEPLLRRLREFCRIVEFRP